MAGSKNLFINSVQLMDFDGSVNVPTVLCYRKDRIHIGADAIANAATREDITEEFKIDLGNHEPGSPKTRTRFATAAARLHEELIPVTARWTDPKIRKGVLTAYARDAESRYSPIGLLRFLCSAILKK